MNHSLADVFQKLNLEPGTYRCELPEQEILVEVRSRKPPEVAPNSKIPSGLETVELEGLDESSIMLDPWVELPRPKPIGRVIGRLAPLPLPDIPEIPAEDEML